MRHQNGRRKLNVKPSHKKSLMRNQVIHLITYGHLTSTKLTVKEVQRFAEKLVTLAAKATILMHVVVQRRFCRIKKKRL